MSGYSGDAGDSLQYEGDWGDGRFGKYYHNGMKFSTYDQDNDMAPDNCAATRVGGWWYNACFWACLCCDVNNVMWYTKGSVVNSRMMIKPQ